MPSLNKATCQVEPVAISSDFYPLRHKSINFVPRSEDNRNYDVSKLQSTPKDDLRHIAMAVQNSHTDTSKKDLTSPLESEYAKHEDNLQQILPQATCDSASRRRESALSESVEDLILFKGRKVARIETYEDEGCTALECLFGQNPAVLIDIDESRKSLADFSKYLKDIEQEQEQGVKVIVECDQPTGHQLIDNTTDTMRFKKANWKYQQFTCAHNLVNGVVHRGLDSKLDDADISAEDGSGLRAESCANLPELFEENGLSNYSSDKLIDREAAHTFSKNGELGSDNDDILLLDDNHRYTHKKASTSSENACSDADETVGVSENYHTKIQQHKQFRFHEELAAPEPNRMGEARTHTTLDYEDSSEYNIMDRERIGISRRPRTNTTACLGFELSDSELEKALYATWVKDRRKKKDRKIEREEARAQGFMGHKLKKLHLQRTTVSSNVITIEDFGRAVEDFLTGDEESFALPPMDKRRRKVVHEIANSFNIKSSSKGSGRNRFPVLYKTRRTLHFDEELFQNLKAQYHGFFPRPGRNPGSRDPLPKTRPFKASAVGDAAYVEGDIVGAAAPELALNNRGRAMLEKMGWSIGTALGAVNNKGILQPVAHVVRRSKAGLG